MYDLLTSISLLSAYFLRLLFCRNFYWVRNSHFLLFLTFYFRLLLSLSILFFNKVHYWIFILLKDKQIKRNWYFLTDTIKHPKHNLFIKLSFSDILLSLLFKYGHFMFWILSITVFMLKFHSLLLYISSIFVTIEVRYLYSIVICIYFMI
jgi:hypothetical protein